MSRPETVTIDGWGFVRTPSVYPHLLKRASMSNTTECILLLGGTIVGDQAAELVYHLTGCGWEDADAYGDDVYTALMHQCENGVLHADMGEVEEGTMTFELQTFLDGLNRPYAWQMGVSECEGSRVLVCDAGGQDHLCIPKDIHGNLLMPIALAHDPKALARYQHFAGLLATLGSRPFIAAPTAHQALQIQASKDTL